MEADTRMAHVGQQIDNHRTGERIIFRVTSAEGSDEVLRFDYVAAPGAAGPPEHIHLDQEESFAVSSGSGRFRVAGRELMLRAGESASVPAGTPHTFTNASDEELAMTIEIRPAKDMERFFETLFALGRAGKTDASGRAGLLQDAVLAREYGVFLARPPVWLQRPAIAALAFVGRLLGKRARYEERRSH
jgi:mannose-6-phosphate isomerase-like protein (cupin superfamily)